MQAIEAKENDDQVDRYEPGFLAFAFRSYEQAEAKCLEFNDNDMHGSSTLFVGKVLKSVSRIYEETCEELKKTPLTMTDAAGHGYDSFMEAVTQHEPLVYKRMCQKREEFWSHRSCNTKLKLNPLVTVFFTVHSVVQSWGYNGPPRAWHHPDYEEYRDDQKEVKRLAGELKISKLIYDEVSYQDMVKLVPKVDVDKCKKVAKAVKNWDTAKLPEKYNAYRSVSPGNSQGDISFSDCISYIDERFDEDDIKEVNVSSVPFGKDRNEKCIYRSQHGTKYCLRTQRWWQVLGANMVILTTEDLPTKLLVSS
jgi:hypothetical protein